MISVKLHVEKIVQYPRKQFSFAGYIFWTHCETPAALVFALSFLCNVLSFLETCTNTFRRVYRNFVFANCFMGICLLSIYSFRLPIIGVGSVYNCGFLECIWLKLHTIIVLLHSLVTRLEKTHEYKKTALSIISKTPLTTSYYHLWRRQ